MALMLGSTARTGAPMLPRSVPELTADPYSLATDSLGCRPS